ncbi:Hypothetical protein Cp262_2193 [Corynebacterium pseudotuberculosis]|nr:Hypothetical protein Cp262_2193 [Corynebacterium pseudotuberculosis]
MTHRLHNATLDNDHPEKHTIKQSHQTFIRQKDLEIKSQGQGSRLRVIDYLNGLSHYMEELWLVFGTHY